MILLKLQPDHNKITWLRVYDYVLSRLRAAPLSDSVSLRLRLFKALTSHVTVTRRLILQKARRHILANAPTCCGLMVSGSISLPSPGFFSPFPHGTGSLSVSREYLALEDGPPIFSQDTTCPDLLFVTTTKTFFVYGAITLYG